MKILIALVVLSLVALSILSDYLWHRWIAARKAERDHLDGPRA